MLAPERRLVLAHRVVLAELVDQLLRHRGGLARLGDVLQQHAELVAADARDEVVAAHAGAQARGDHLEQAVAHVVAEPVVHLLEVVEVDEQHGGGLVVAPRVRHGFARALLEHGAVRQPGERVVVREELQAPRVVLQLDRGEAQVLLRALERGDVVAEHVEAEHRALGREVRHAGDLQRARAAAERGFGPWRTRTALPRRRARARSAASCARSFPRRTPRRRCVRPCAPAGCRTSCRRCGC